jgi:hypothetical protein
MSINTTDMVNFIDPLFISEMLNTYTGKLFLDSLFSDGVAVEDAFVSGQNMKMASACIKEYDGKATTVRVPILPVLTGSISDIGEETGGESEYDLTLGKCDITVTEKGDQYIPITGKASLQLWNSATALALSACAGLAADSKERMIGAVITAGGTKQYSEAADSVMYWQATPVQVGQTAVYEPNADLTATDIKSAAAKLKGVAEPFENGYLIGLIHPYALPSLLIEAGDEMRDMQISQAAAGLGNMAKGYVGVYHGIAFFQCANPYLYSASGGSGGIGACKTVIFGRGFLAKGWVSPNALKSPDSGITCLDFADFQVRITADATDIKRRNSNATWYAVMNYAIADRTQGLYIYHTIKEFETTGAVNVA